MARINQYGILIAVRIRK